MRVVQIGVFPKDVNCIKGGVEASVYGLSKALVSSGHKVYALDLPRRTIHSDLECSISSISVFRFKAIGNNFLSFLRIPRYLETVKRLKPQICHLHSTSLFCFLLYLLLLFTSRKCIVTVHGLAHIEKKNLWQQKKSLQNFFKYIYQSGIEFIFLSLCSEIIVDTEYVQSEIKKWKQSGKLLRMPRCHVIPQGVDPVYFTLNRCPIPYHIISVGAFTKRKGHLYLIKSMKKVLEMIPEAKLTIAGVSNQPAYLEAMQQEILSLDLSDSVNLMPNAIQDDIKKLFVDASIFALHSEEESQGIVLCEALAVGLPIVSTTVGGIPYVVEHAKNGLLSEYGDDDHFAGNILQLLQHETERKTISMANIIDSRKYNWQDIASRIEYLY